MCSIRYFPQSPNSFSPRYIKFAWTILTKTLSQKNFINFVRNEILTGHRYTCDLLISHVCKCTEICLTYHMFCFMIAEYKLYRLVPFIMFYNIN